MRHFGSKSFFILFLLLPVCQHGCTGRSRTQRDEWCWCPLWSLQGYSRSFQSVKRRKVVIIITHNNSICFMKWVQVVFDNFFKKKEKSSLFQTCQHRKAVCGGVSAPQCRWCPADSPSPAWCRHLWWPGARSGESTHKDLISTGAHLVKFREKCTLPVSLCKKNNWKSFFLLVYQPFK